MTILNACIKKGLETYWMHHVIQLSDKLKEEINIENQREIFMFNRFSFLIGFFIAFSEV